MTRIATHYATPDDDRSACGQRVHADGWGQDGTNVSDDMARVTCGRCLRAWAKFSRENP